jgi:heptosyltransferase-2
MVAADWENLLILQTSFLGDTVLTLPLIAEVKRRFPVRTLSVLCQPLSRELLQGHPAIDEIIVDDKKTLDRGFAGLRRKAAELAARGFTLGLTPHKSLRSALMLYLADIPTRVGFSQSRGWFLFHHRVERNLARHDVERNLSILEAFGVKVEECRRDLDLPVSPAAEASVAQKLKDLGIITDQPMIGVNPGSVWPTKRWSPEGFARLIVLLRQKYQCPVALFGGAADAAVAKEVFERSQGGAINLAGQLSLGELPAAIRRCRVFVTNDSGPMHIAVAERVPTVALFCATTADLGFYPYTQHAVVVEKRLSCRPCSTHGGLRCPLGHQDCSRLIDAETVLNAVEKLLSADPPSRDSPLESFAPEFLAV